MTFDALAAKDIPLEGLTIKTGEVIIVNKRNETNLLLTPKGFVSIADDFIGSTIKLYPDLIEWAGKA